MGVLRLWPGLSTCFLSELIMGDGQLVSSPAGSRSLTVSSTATGLGKHITRIITYIFKEEKVSINELKLLCLPF